MLIDIYLIKTFRLVKKMLMLSKVQQWLDVNKLSLNISKIHYIIISPQFTEKYIYQIKLEENLLSKTENHKYLGVIIDENLSWKPHIVTITSKLSKLCEIL